MLVLMRRAIIWRPNLPQTLCQFCSDVSPQVVPEHKDYDQLQGTRSSLGRKSTKDLAIRLHKTHMKLKDALREGETFEEVWSKHSSDISDLSSYAASMHRMGLKWEHQISALNFRNSWIMARVKHYYFKRHNLVLLQDELRKAQLDPTLLTPHQEGLIRGLQQVLSTHCEQQLLKDVHDSGARPEGRGGPDGTAQVECEGKGAAEVLPGDAPLPEALVFSEDSDDGGQLHATSRVRVLDVGSCYNPLGRYPLLHVTPIDLMPATQDVYKCDFLNVEVVAANEACDLQHEGEKGEKDPGGHRQIKRLPRNYYDVVVFSLVLDYIPCPEARLRCCSKAHQLLRPGGLMLIITPARCCNKSTKILKKHNQLLLARLGYGRLNKQDRENYETFSYRKGFFQSLWSVAEVRKIESELRSLRNRLNAANIQEDNIDKFNLGNGLYFAMDVASQNE